jgi:hypothetical protein
MPRLLELVSNEDGRISRTQCMIWIAFVLTVCLTIAHVLCGNVLDAPVLWVLAGTAFFLLIDRTGARFISMRFGGVHVQAGSEGATNAVDIRNFGGHSGLGGA